MYVDSTRKQLLHEPQGQIASKCLEVNATPYIHETSFAAVYRSDQIPIDNQTRIANLIARALDMRKTHALAQAKLVKSAAVLCCWSDAECLDP